VDYSNPDTIDNLITTMDLICQDNYHVLVASIGAVTLLGFLIGSIVLTPKTDVYGRYTMASFLLSTNCIGLALFVLSMYFNWPFFVVVLATFLSGCMTIPLIAVILCYATEMTTMDMMDLLVGLSFISEALCSILIGSYFKHFKNAVNLYAIVTAGISLFTLLFIFFA
jgi:MFS family permease